MVGVEAITLGPEWKPCSEDGRAALPALVCSSLDLRMKQKYTLILLNPCTGESLGYKNLDYTVTNMFNFLSCKVKMTPSRLLGGGVCSRTLKVIIIQTCTASL